MKKLQSLENRICVILNKPIVRILLLSSIFICLLILSKHAYADGTDYLQGTDQGMDATITGTGKKYLYAGEFVVSVIAYIKSKNPAVLLGIIVVAIFFNIFLHLSGIS